MKQTIYDVDYFIKKFEAIPEIMWLTGTQGEGYGHPACAYGHCRNNINDVHGSSTNQGEALRKLFFDSGFRWNMVALNGKDDLVIDGKFEAVAAINNGWIKEYQQPTPKQRILAALYDIKKMQEIEQGGVCVPAPEPVKFKQIIRYVSVPQSIKDQTKEVILS